MWLCTEDIAHTLARTNHMFILTKHDHMQIRGQFQLKETRSFYFLYYIIRDSSLRWHIMSISKLPVMALQNCVKNERWPGQNIWNLLKILCYEEWGRNFAFKPALVCTLHNTKENYDFIYLFMNQNILLNIFV